MLYGGSAALFVVSVLANISLSLRHGRLLAPPLYDDVSYLKDAMERLMFRGEGNGMWGTLSSFVLAPPHSPFSTATGMLGFWLFGPYPVSAYVAGSWMLAVYVFALILMSRPLGDPLKRLLFVAAFLFVPASHAIVNEFRPDMGAGLLFGLALHAICTEEMASSNVRRMLGIGLLAAVAVIAKPSAVVATVPMLGLAAVISVLRHSFPAGRPVREVLAWLIPAGGVFACIIVPFAILWGPKTVPYIYQALVTNIDVWRTPGSRGFHWAFHSFGIGGSLGLGPFLYVGLVVYLGNLTWAIGRKFPPESQGFLGYLGVLCVLYVAMANSEEKTVFQGSFFYFPFVVGMAHALGRNLAALQRLSPPVGAAAAAVLLTAATAALVLFEPFASTYTQPPAASVQAAPVYDSVLAAVIRHVKEEQGSPACFRPVPKIVATNPYPFPNSAIVFAAATRGIRLDLANTYLSRSFEEARAKVLDSDFVMGVDPGMPGLNRHLPGTRFMGAINDLMKSDPAFSTEVVGRVGEFPVWLYTRRCTH